MFLMELFSLYFLSFCGRTTLILRSFVILYLWQVLVKLGNMTMYISALLLCAFSVFYGISCQFNILGSKLTVFLVIDRYFIINIVPTQKLLFKILSSYLLRHIFIGCICQHHILCNNNVSLLLKLNQCVYLCCVIKMLSLSSKYFYQVLSIIYKL